MLILAVCLSICAVPVLAWAYLLCGHGGFWRTDQRLPAPAGDAPGAREWPGVTAIVPARNEAAILPATLPTLLAQDYPGPLQVVLVDDASSDGTAEVAASLAAAGAGAALRVVPAAPLPPGWAGKVWAMSQGLREAGGSAYVLFTDADISYAPGTLASLVRAAEDGGLGLVSQMALLRAGSGWERLIVPAFVYFFAQLYPFRRVNRPGSRTAAAAGGCMLVRRGVLEQAGGLERIRDARIDDVALGRLLKGAGARCWLGLATSVLSQRPYPRLAELWDMIARSAYTQLGYSPGLLAGTVAGLAWLYALPPAATIAGLGWLAAGGGTAALAVAFAGLAAWAMMAVSYLPMLALYRVPWWHAPGLPVVAVLYTAMTVDSARRYYLGRGGQWKGRVIPARLPRQAHRETHSPDPGHLP